MSQFSTNEFVSLEKRIEVSKNFTKTSLDNLNFVYEIDRCAKWILDNDYNKVCLQFPDYLLPDACQIVQKIEKIIEKKVYILGDTAYESCCVDYTAASHISADAIIHFGAICFSKPENIIPCLKIHEKYAFDTEIFCDCVKNKFTKDNVVIIVNTPYLYKIEKIEEQLTDHKVLSIENDLTNIEDKIVVYVGEDDRKLMNINFSIQAKELYYFDPKKSNEILKYVQDIKILKRRYFLIEKIKDSNTIGIVISTLAVKNYLKLIDRIKTLVKIHNKKYYVISVGKPTVAKLANFPEVDIFVVVGCAMNDIYEDRGFYKPIVTPFDLEAALNPKLQNTQFSYDFNKFLSDANEITDEIMSDFKQSDISLLTGNIRCSSNQKSDLSDSLEESGTDKSVDNKIAIRNEGKLAISDNYGAGFLANRSWTGLEQNLGKNEPHLATKGRKGVAQSYENETD